MFIFSFVTMRSDILRVGLCGCLSGSYVAALWFRMPCLSQSLPRPHYLPFIYIILFNYHPTICLCLLDRKQDGGWGYCWWILEKRGRCPLKTSVFYMTSLLSCLAKHFLATWLRYTHMDSFKDLAVACYLWFTCW